jgi:glutamate-1-semialdehyde 2,1-aminomutase
MDQFLQNIIQEYMSRTPRSKEAHLEAERFYPGGVQSSIRYFKPYPFHIAKGKGGKVWDIDGNEYIDFCMAYGGIIAGHTHPKIINAIEEQIQQGSLFGMPDEKTTPFVKELLRRYPMMQSFCLTNSGGEAVLFALRAARTYSGRTKIIKMEGSYHGSTDPMEISVGSQIEKAGPKESPTAVPNSGGITANTLKDTIVAPFNDIDALEKIIIKNKEDIAAVIVEPVMLNSGVVLPKGSYLNDLRKLTNEHNIVLIFDEVKVGCRISPGGAAEYYEIRPDMVTLAKSIGGGLPIAAVGCKKEIMTCIEPLGMARHSGTYYGNPLVVSAGLACLKEVLVNDAYIQMNRLGEMLRKGIDDAVQDSGIVGKVHSIGPIGMIFFTDKEVVDYRSAQTSNNDVWYRYWLSMINKGVIISGNTWHQSWFICTMHDEDEINQTIQTADRVLHGIAKKNSST